jgi:DNA-binding NarL/FixJ family response regulator
MKAGHTTIYVTSDIGLLGHWQKAIGKSHALAFSNIEDFFQFETERTVAVWIDLSVPHLPSWSDAAWRNVMQNELLRLVATSSNPHDEQAMAALDAGCVAYCHAFSNASTLKQVKEVVDAGQVWIGKSLMQRLLQNVNRVVKTDRQSDIAWQQGLTQREIQVAILAANGASNGAIANQCKISERTVKAHLSAVFGKINITDRLQLALRVHGIQ